MRFFDTRLGRCATLLALGGGVALYAQGTQTASATVTVVDRSGAPVVNARVRLTSPSMMAERTGVTSPSGVFIARLLPPGTYTIEVIKDGFQTTKDTRAIGMDQHYQPRIVLQPVGNTTVEVISTASSAVDPTDIKTAHNYDASRIDELPMGRTPDAMALLSPGVTTGVGGRTQVRGAMTSSNLYLLDGQPVNDNTYMTNTTHLITDSFEETQVITGAISAEYGNVDGGVINTLTKSGGNTFTGQFRVDLSNAQWNAMKAMTGETQRSGVRNILNETRQYTVGGFFLKDTVWFHFSGQTVDSSSAGNVYAQSTHPTEAGVGFTSDVMRRYYMLKLTYRVNEDHSIIGTYSHNNVVTDNRTQFTVGELRALGEQGEMSSITNIAWRATWSPALNSDIRFGTNTKTLGSGPKRGSRDPNNIQDSVVRTYGASPSNIYYNTYPFDQRDNPEHRDNRTGNIKFSYFADWNGSHELDFGFDYYKGIRSGINQQSVTGYTFFVYRMKNPTAPAGTGEDHGLNGANDYAAPNFVVKWPGNPAEATSTSMGLYVNDKWKLDNHWAFQIGFRFDNYKAQSTDSDQTAGASGFSPRLGATYDIWGDQRLILKASYCVYNAAVLEVISGAASGAANIGQEQWYYSGPGATEEGDPNNYQPKDVVFNLANYTDFAGSYNPTINIFIDPNLKPPVCDEIQLGASYSLTTDDYGKGYLSLTYVSKKWKNMIDYQQGNNPINWVPDPDDPDDRDSDMYTTYWTNEPLAKRDYTALELAADWTYNNLHVGGNITWSQLKGNYEGEGSSNPGSGQGLSYFRELQIRDPQTGQVTEVRKMYDTETMDPVGYLDGHKPVVMNWTAEYTSQNAYGKTTFGFVYTREAGTQFTRGRNYPSQFVNPLLPSTDYGRTAYQYRDGLRTHGSFPSEAYHDLAITHDFNLFKVKGTQVRAFAKMVIYNVFNHQQLLSWNEPSYKQVTVAEMNAAGGDLNKVPWVEDPALAAASKRGVYTYSNFGTPRTITVHAGLRF